MLATGTDFPDGLSAGAAAGSYWDESLGTPIGGAVLLTKGSTVPAATAAYVSAAIAGHTDPANPVDVSTVGGLATAAYKGPRKIALAGQDRYQTSALVAEAHFGMVPMVGLATGTSFPDALSGGAFAAQAGMPLLLTPPSLLTATETASYLHVRSAAIDTAVIFGGTLVVSSTVAAQATSIIGVHSQYAVLGDRGAASAGPASGFTRPDGPVRAGWEPPQIRRR
jgi:hypothetical protein